jgi:Kef-type K+ transport system membrane component KefB
MPIHFLALNLTNISPLTDPVYLLCVLLMVISIAPLLAKKIKIPALVVLIVLGTIIGDNTLGIVTRDQQLILLEKFGLLYIMLLAGMQMDLSNLKRLGSRSLIFGLLTFAVPLTVGVITGKVLAYGLLAALLLGIVYSPHTLISYPIMTRLDLLRNEATNVAVGGTIVTSILTLTGLSLIQSMTTGNISFVMGIKLFVLLPVFMGLYLWGIPKIGQSIFQDNPEALSSQFIYVLTCLFIAASVTLLLGVDSIIGAFIAGLALNPLIPVTSTLMKRIDFVGNSLFIPIFLISVGVLCNPKVLLTNPENLGIALLVIVGAVGSKFVAAWLSGRANNYSFSEVMVMFSLTMSRAALVLVIALFGKTSGLFNEGIFNAIILYIVVTCLAGPIQADIFGKKVAANQSKEIEQEAAQLKV